LEGEEKVGEDALKLLQSQLQKTSSLGRGGRGGAGGRGKLGLQLLSAVFWWKVARWALWEIGAEEVEGLRQVEADGGREKLRSSWGQYHCFLKLLLSGKTRVFVAVVVECKEESEKCLFSKLDRSLALGEISLALGEISLALGEMEQRSKKGWVMVHHGSICKRALTLDCSQRLIVVGELPLTSNFLAGQTDLSDLA
jgi:hypothetical protein